MKNHHKNYAHFFLFFLFIPAFLALAPDNVNRVARVIDGDTIELENGERVRYIGINAPEIDHLFGKEAAEANSTLVYGKEIYLQYDDQERDKYGRLLAYVYIDSIFINGWLVEHGYAQILSIPPNLKYQDNLLNLQQIAKEQNRGLWAKTDKKPKEEISDPIVYVTKTGKKYHLANCRYLKKSKIPIHLSEALARDYTACSMCGASSLKIKKAKSETQNAE